METTRKQIGKITRDIREKNCLSQEKLATKLFIASGKQLIYCYEKGERTMKLPEFIEFIKMFDEEVLINKNGISLVDKESKIVNDKESQDMFSEKDFTLLERVGDVYFYEHNESKKQYQKAEGFGCVLVEDGKMKYKVIEEYNNLSIKYNLNGTQGYSIWMNDICYEDGFWSLKDAKECVEEIFTSNAKAMAVSVMVKNVENKLEDENLSLEDLDFSNVHSFVDCFDDIFSDGGEFRCEGFMDIAIPYALHYGEMETEEFYDALWECAEEAYKELENESLKTVVCKDSSYSREIIKFDYIKNNDNSFSVTLSKNNKRLIFKEFYFGCNEPSLEIVLEAIKDDYTLFKSSPTLKSYKENRGDMDDIELDYKILKLDVKSIIQFFGKEYLENIINE